MKTLIIYNSFSGVKRDKGITYIKSKLKMKCDIVDVYESENDIKEYVICNGAYYDLLIVIGGDGTINHAINGLMMIHHKPLLAYIPMGTCNDFGRSLGLKKEIDNVIESIFNGNIKDIYVNKINTDYYLYGLAVGNMTHVSYKINNNLKRRFGKIGYYLNAVKSLFISNNFKVELKVNGNIVKEDCFCLLLLNSKFLASMKLRLKNDYIDNRNIKVVLIKKKNRIINLIDLIMFLLFGEYYFHNISYYEGDNIQIKIDKPMNFNMDGECLPSLSNVDIKRTINGIKLIVYK